MPRPPNESLEAYNARMNAEAHTTWHHQHPEYSRHVMPNINQMLQSKYIAKADLQQPFVATIRGVAMEGAAGNQEPKWLMYFHEERKPMRLTNAVLKYLGATLGPNTDNWIGKRVQLYVDQTIMMAGEVVGGIRVRVSKRDMISAQMLNTQMSAATGPENPLQAGPVFGGFSPGQSTQGPGSPPPPQRTPPSQNQPQRAAGPLGAGADEYFDGVTGETAPPARAHSGHVGDNEFDDDIQF